MILGPWILKRSYDHDGNATFSKTCEVTGEKYSVTVSHGQLAALVSPDRPLIQDVLPDHSVEEREFLMTGITPAEWARDFPVE